MKKRRIQFAAVLLCAALLFTVLPQSARALSDADIAAPAAVLMEAGTGTVLYEKNAHEQRPCASITKVMTLLLVMEALDDGKIAMTDTVTCSAHAASMGGSDIWLREGETMSVDDLLKATVIMSANDAAVALAEYVAGSEDDFVRQMNTRAAELGMDDTVFKNCNGLDEDGHLSSAYDVALMSRELIRHEEIFSYTLTWMDYVRQGQTQLVNTNKLIRTYNGITGLKTGTTGAAGSCITATAKRDNMHLVAVVLGCSSTDDRFRSAAALLDYGFANWCVATPAPVELPTQAVTGAMESEITLQCEAAPSFLVQKGKADSITCTLSLPETLQAPVMQDDTVGSIVYSLDGTELGRIPVTAAQPANAITTGSVFSYLLRIFFTL